METKESRSPAPAVSTGERALAELEMAVRPVELELREKTLLLAIVWVESRVSVLDCRRLLLRPVLVVVGVVVDGVDRVGAVASEERLGKDAGLSSDVLRFFRLLKVLELFEVIVCKYRLSVAAYRRDGDEVGDMRLASSRNVARHCRKRCV